MPLSNFFTHESYVLKGGARCPQRAWMSRSSNPCIEGNALHLKRHYRFALATSLLLFGVVMTTAADLSVFISDQPLAKHSGPRGATMFSELPPERTGVVTENNYDDASMWSEHFAEFESGSIGTGVAIGDFDGDGRPDIFVVSKTESCRLFRNLGDWKFADVTAQAGVGDQGEAARIWKQGATFVDVNNDGRLDLYVCRFNAPNLLYVNQGDGTFREEAAARGLAVNDASVMAAFCDYDRDGALDVFIQTNYPQATEHRHEQRNYLFHNNGDGTFTDVTSHAGIGGRAQGHSATWWDYDGDGWPDLYVANDFTPADKLYHNNRDGTFTDVVDQVVPTMPFSSMGSDLGDVNNDGLIDLFVSEMAPTTHQKDQRTVANSRALIVDQPDNSLAAPFTMRNVLYLATGTGRCREAAYLAGLAATDWTWSVRFEDLDNDGRLDLQVTNGMYREAHNADLRERMRTVETNLEKVRMERASPVLAEPNLAFRNLGDLRFEEVGAAWGLNQKGVSFGAALGDLDGDGDLDLVFANYKKGVTVLRNDSDTGRRVIVALHGKQSNRFGVGATVRVETASGSQVRQLVLARGYMSSSEPILHFGLGEDSVIKRMTVEWPSGQKQSFAELAADRKYTITEPEGVSVGPALVAVPRHADERQPYKTSQFTEVSGLTNLLWSSRETKIDEISSNSLQPMRLNRRGPALAIGDVNGDGRDDVIVGGTPTDPTRLLLAQSSGGFVPGNLPAELGGGSLDDGPVLLFDADGDGANDLLVTKGGVALPADSAEYQPKLYLNDGHGVFRSTWAGAVPAFPVSVGAVAAADFDHYGQLSLFLGGRVHPGHYPRSPRSALFVNRGGRFEDVTEMIAPGLRAVGMVTSALWSDVDADGWPDLLLTLEWGQVKYFHNSAGKKFEDWTEKSGFATAGTGWWNSIAAADFNGDGRLDYVVGNLGLNTPYQADPAHPALLFSGDFKGGGTEQLIEAYYEGDRLYPWRTRKDLGAAIPFILKRYPRNDLYARATLGEILGEDTLADAQRYAATEFRSGVLLSQPEGTEGATAGATYRFEPLPRIAQIAPIQGVVAGDFDGDGHADIYAVQNSSAPIPSTGRFAGGFSQLLRGDGHGHFTAVPPMESGLIVPDDAQALAVLDFNDDGWPDFLITRNNSTTLAYQNTPVASPHVLRVGLHGPLGNPTAVGARITLELTDGAKQMGEITAGSGYYSQSTSACFFGWPEGNPPCRLHVRWPSGRITDHRVSPLVRSLNLTAP